MEFLFSLLPFLDPENWRARRVQAALAKCRDPKIKAFLPLLPEIATDFWEAADTIYQKIVLEQFRDYETRYGEGLLARLEETRKSTLICAICSYMLYTLFRHVEQECSQSDIPYQLTVGLQGEMEKVGIRTGSLEGEKRIPPFMDYVHYQNPHFEDARMAPAFRFGNEIGGILEQLDRPFVFMAAQQAMMIAEITKVLISRTEQEEEGKRSKTHAPTISSPSGNPHKTTQGAPIQLMAKYFGWWFAWGVFSGIMVLIVMQGGSLRWGAQIFVVLGMGLLSGTAALFYTARKRLK